MIKTVHYYLIKNVHLYLVIYTCHQNERKNKKIPTKKPHFLSGALIIPLILDLIQRLHL